jgi:hypothetical protein
VVDGLADADALADPFAFFLPVADGEGDGVGGGE